MCALWKSHSGCAASTCIQDDKILTSSIIQNMATGEVLVSSNMWIYVVDCLVVICDISSHIITHRVCGFIILHSPLHFGVNAIEQIMHLTWPLLTKAIWSQDEFVPMNTQCTA